MSYQREALCRLRAMKPTRFIALIVLILSGFVIPSPLFAQDAYFRKSVTELVQEARRFQTPLQALHHWGDPKDIEGAMSPTLTFSRAGARVVLSYGPPAKAPYRLSRIAVRQYVVVVGEGGRVRPDLAPQRVAAIKRELLAWLGEPESKAGGSWGESWYYWRKDRAGFGVVQITFWEFPGDTPEVEVVVDGRPR